MLVLMRKEGEKVYLRTSDGEIEVTVARIKGKESWIGFEAPESVEILREELIAGELEGNRN